MVKSVCWRHFCLIRSFHYLFFFFWKYVLVLRIVEEFVKPFDTFAVLMCKIEEWSVFSFQLLNSAHFRLYLFFVRGCIAIGRILFLTLDTSCSGCSGGYNGSSSCFQHGRIIFVHAFHVPANVHLLFGTVHTKWTLELRIFAAFPFLMVSQWWFQFVDTSTIGCRTHISTAALFITTTRRCIRITIAIMSRLQKSRDNN